MVVGTVKPAKKEEMEEEKELYVSHYIIHINVRLQLKIVCILKIKIRSLNYSGVYVCTYAYGVHLNSNLISIIIIT